MKWKFPPDNDVPALTKTVEPLELRAILWVALERLPGN
jgi:hypothetical protein